MGLDMYLYRIDGNKVAFVAEEAEEIGYWRKANAIHKWFVDNVQNGNDDCEQYNVSPEKIKELLNVCQAVLKNPAEANKLLPTASGFFFGETDYGDGYLDDLDQTVKILDEALKNDKEDHSTYYYYSSW
jgi:hypothetical protein